MRLAAILIFLAVTLRAQHFVHIPSTNIEMSATEVTVGQYARFVKATGYQTVAERDSAARTRLSPGYQVEKKQPVTYVSANDAAKYCEYTGGRLPSDAEWETAARAGAATRHYWGDAVDGDYLWYRANSGHRPRVVGKKKPNAWGLYDMEGNVWEWTITEPEKGEPMAARRGGSWIDCEDIDGGPGKPPGKLLGLSVRFKIPVKLEHRYDDIGFRCVRAVEARATTLGSK